MIEYQLDQLRPRSTTARLGRRIIAPEDTAPSWPPALSAAYCGVASTTSLVSSTLTQVNLRSPQGPSDRGSRICRTIAGVMARPLDTFPSLIFASPSLRFTCIVFDCSALIARHRRALSPGLLVGVKIRGPSTGMLRHRPASARRTRRRSPARSPPPPCITTPRRTSVETLATPPGTNAGVRSGGYELWTPRRRWSGRPSPPRRTAPSAVVPSSWTGIPGDPTDGTVNATVRAPASIRHRRHAPANAAGDRSLDDCRGRLQRHRQGPLTARGAAPNSSPPPAFPPMPTS
jgi:hypothetical protein